MAPSTASTVHQGMSRPSRAVQEARHWFLEAVRIAGPSLLQKHRHYLRTELSLRWQGECSRTPGKASPGKSCVGRGGPWRSCCPAAGPSAPWLTCWTGEVAGSPGLLLPAHRELPCWTAPDTASAVPEAATAEPPDLTLGTLPPAPQPSRFRGLSLGLATSVPSPGQDRSACS